MSIVPRSIKTILTLDILLFICGLIGIYFISLKSDLPFSTEYQNSIITIKELMHDSTLSLAGRKIISIDAKQFSSPEETETYLDGFRKGDKVRLTFSDQSQIEVKLINYYSILYNLLALIIGSSFFVIAILVLIKAKLQKPARIFHWVCVFTALIIMATWGYYNFQPRVIPMAVRTVLHFSVSIVPALFLHFTLTFPKEKKGINKNWIRALYTVSAIVFLMLSFNFFNLIFNTTIDSIKSYVDSYNVSRVFLIVCVLAAIVLFIFSYKTSSSESDKKKLKWILYGLSIGPLSFILFWTLPIIIMDRSILPEELILIIISIIPITFAISIVKYHVLDIDYLINRSFVYSIVVGFLLATYMLIIGLLTNFAFPEEAKISAIISAAAIVILFQPIRKRVQDIVDEKFFRVRYNFRVAIKNIFKEINESLDTNSLSKKIVKNIDDLMPVEKIGFFILNAANDRLKLISQKNFDLLVNRTIRFHREELKTELSLPVALPNKVEAGVLIEIADVKVFQKWGIHLVIPIKSVDNKLYGFLVLGAKKSHTKFSMEDVDLLNAIAQRAAASIDRIKLQEELFLKNIESERLDELNSMKSYFISSVSHDMKTPLTSIKMFAELLQYSKEIDSEKASEYLEMIEGESNRLTRLIDNVLDFAKIERGIKKYNFENISLNEIVNRTMKVMHYQFKLHRFEVELNLSEEEKIIYADKDAVEEALINLLSNSIKYSSDNRFIKVSTHLVNDFMILTVEDKGTGIDKEHVDTIFNPFFRIDSKGGQKSGGAGLGLSIVKNIMDSHKGKIEVQSEQGKGSRFVLLFPIEKLENK